MQIIKGSPGLKPSGVKRRGGTWGFKGAETGALSGSDVQVALLGSCTSTTDLRFNLIST